MDPTPNGNEVVATYRDKIATVDEQGRRIWIYPKQPEGRFYRWRTQLTWGLLLILFGLPFIQVNGQPLVLFNVLERHFIIFGLHFTPQDFHLFVLAMLTLLVFIVLFTMIFGRLFCGWICPQTIFMEMVFRKIEYWIEGNANAQRRLNNAPWTTDKVRKKVAKHGIFLLLSVLIAHVFLSYIIGLQEVQAIVSQPPAQDPVGFAAMLAFTGAFYFVFARLREQVCTTICPYGRLQGVMTDEQTILVAYDFVRGEPRGKLRRKQKADPVENIRRTATTVDGQTTGEEAPLRIQGDCIDCSLCVQVCPTGIDIRDGVQLECVQCTACIDACDAVMDKIDRPRGLIRYDSHNGILSQERRLLNTRVVAYSAVLLLLIAVNAVLLSNRSAVEAVILRTPGVLYQRVDNDHIRNLYSYQVFNKTARSFSLEFKLQGEQGHIRLVGEAPTLSGNDRVEGAFFIEMTEGQLSGGKQAVFIEVYADGQLLDKVKTNFLGPIK